MLLLDRGRFPRDKSCGDGLTLPAVRLLAEMGVLERLGEVRKIAGTRVFMRGKGYRDFLYPVGRDTLNYGLVVPRHRLDHALCRRAVEAGARMWDRSLVTKFTPENSGASLEVMHRGKLRRLHASVVVAADGAASRLALQAGLADGVSEASGVAVRGYFRGISGLTDLLEIYMPLTDPTDRYILPSYAWVFPTGPFTANIGVGIFERSRVSSLRDLMRRLLNDLRHSDGRFREMQPLGPWRTAPLNSAFRPEKCSVPGLALAGDAAGLISPFTGEGISYALESGKLLAEAVDRNLRPGGAAPDLSDYQMMLENRYMGYFEMGRRSARRYLLVWHVLESTFHNEKPLFAICRKAALFPEGMGDSSQLLDDVGGLIDRAELNVRQDLLAVGEILLHAVRKDWPFLARFSASGKGDPGVPFRPALLLLLTAAVQNGGLGTRREDLLQTAAAVELGYMAALAHLSVDDGTGARLQDGERPANWGNMLALTAGDFLLSKAYELSSQVSADTSRMIADSLTLACEGRLREQRTAFSADLSDDTWLEIATLKIATLFNLPCQLGAMLSGVGSAQIDAMAAYGRNLGIAFMLTDQVLELRGEPSELGKLLAADRKEGIYSRPLWKALRKAGAEGLREILGNGEKPVIAAMVEDTGAIAESLAEAEMYARRAKAALAVPDGPARRTLWRLAEYAIHRDAGQRADLAALI